MADANEHFPWSFWIAIACGILYVLVKTYHARRLVYNLQKQGLPMPPFSWVTGHLFAIKPYAEKVPTDAEIDYTVIEMALSLGKEAFYLDFWPLSEPSLILISPAMASQVTQQYSLRKSPAMLHAFAGMMGVPNLLTMPDPEWKRWRGIFKNGFSPNSIQQQTSKIVDECRVFAQKMQTRVRENKMCYLSEDTARLALDVLCIATLDGRWHYQRFDSRIPESIRGLVEWTSFSTEVNPFLRWNPMRRYKLSTYGREVNEYIKSELDKRFAERFSAKHSESGAQGNKSIAAHALDTYMAEGEESGTPYDAAGTLDDTFKTYACSQIRIFLTDHDTTSAVILWTLHLLSTNPDCLSLLRTEHNDVFGPQTDPDAIGDHIARDPPLLNHLPYTTACIKETLRLFPPASTVRMGSPDAVFVDSNGTRYPSAGCTVWAGHLAIQRNPAAFADPNAFKPARWLPSTLPGDPLYPSAKGAWRPFEFGPRSCAGQTLVMATVKIVLVMCARAFDFRPAYEEWDRLHPPRWWGAGAGKIRTALGDRAYQVQRGGGGAQPVNGYPCRVSIAAETERV